MVHDWSDLSKLPQIKTQGGQIYVPGSGDFQAKTFDITGDLNDLSLRLKALTIGYILPIKEITIESESCKEKYVGMPIVYIEGKSSSNGDLSKQTVKFFGLARGIEKMLLTGLEIPTVYVPNDDVSTCFALPIVNLKDFLNSSKNGGLGVDSYQEKIKAEVERSLVVNLLGDSYLTNDVLVPIPREAEESIYLGK